MSTSDVHECNHVSNTNCQHCLKRYVYQEIYKKWKKSELSTIFGFIPKLIGHQSLLKKFAENLLKIFNITENNNNNSKKKSIPVNKVEASQHESDGNLLGLNLIECSDLLTEILRISPNCHTLEKEIQSKSEHYFKLPEFIVSNDEEMPYHIPNLKKTILPPDYATIVNKIRNLSGNVFDKYLKPNQIRFKDFSQAKENSKNIVRVLYVQQNVYYYLFDLRFFVIEAVHDYYNKMDSSFICNNTDKRCGCIITLAFESLLSNIPDASNSKNLLQSKVMRFTMSFISPVVDSKSTEAANSIPKPKLKPQESEMSEKTNQELNKNVTMKNSGTSSNSPMIITSNYDRKSSVMNNSSVSRDFDTFCNDCVNVSGNSLPIDIAISSDDLINHNNHNNIHCAPHSSFSCEKKPTARYVCTSIINSIPFVIDTNNSSSRQTLPSASLKEYNQFASIILSLAKNVFQFKFIPSSTGKICSLNLFYDESETIAFNLNSRLFFNCYHYNPSIGTVGCYSYYFTIFCHELAHNFESGHNDRHNSAILKLQTKYLPPFISKFIPKS